MHGTQSIPFTAAGNYILQKSEPGTKKIRGRNFNTVVTILQATELFSGKTRMPFYGFKRKEEGMPSIILEQLEKKPREKAWAF